MAHLHKSAAPSNVQRRLRLARRLAQTVDHVLAVAQAASLGQLPLAKERERVLEQAAEALAETLGEMLIHDKDLRPGKNSPAPAPKSPSPGKG